MSLDVGLALREGVNRTATRNGVIFLSVFFLLGVLNSVLIDSMLLWLDSLAAEFDEVEPIAPETGPLAISMSGSVIVMLGLLSFVVTAAASVITIRTMVSSHTRRIPDDLLSHRLTVATVNDLVGNLVAGLLIVVGLLFLVIPGVFLAIGFYFLRPFIAVEDENFVDALVSSWNLSKGNRIEIFVLLLVVIVVTIVFAIPGLVLEFSTASYAPTIDAFLTPALTALTTVFALTVTARAYVQLRPEADDDADETDAPESDDDDEEWPDPPGLDI